MTKQQHRALVKVAAILVVGAIAPMLDTTMTNVAIATIMKSLNSTVDIVQWVTTGYVLAMGVGVPFTGWAVDRFNGKMVNLVGLALFLIGSVISGTATTITALIIGRLIQGAGSGIMIPLLTTLIVRAAGGKNLGSLMAIIGLPMVLIPILGPTIGGYIIQQLNWHWIFYVNIPIAVISIGLIMWLMPDFKPPFPNKRFDWLSFLMLGGMFSGLIIGIVQYSTHDNLAAMGVLLPIFVGLDLMVAYVLYARRFPDRALVNLDMFKFPNFSGSMCILLMSGITVNGAMFILPLYLQNVRGLSVAWAGTYLISQGIGMFISRTQVGKLTDQIGARWVVIVAVVISVLSTLPFAYFDANTSKYLVLVVLFFRGIAQAGMTIPVMSDSYVSLPKELVSQATTATRMLQNVGGAFGSAILATVIQNQINGVVPTVTKLTNAYHMAFIWSVVFTGLAIVPAWFLTHHRSTTSVSEKTSKEAA
ncbi:MDR family MFS transporter [Furfurilactobacillus curtus]